MITQLGLFTPPPAADPGPRCFYVAGMRIERSDEPFGGDTTGGWRAGFVHDPARWRIGGWAPYTIRQMVESWARAAGLPLDLYVRGWRRDARAGLEHWLYWPENGVSCCLDTLELNIVAARQMRPMSELRAWAEWRAQQSKPTKKKARAA